MGAAVLGSLSQITWQQETRILILNTNPLQLSLHQITWQQETQILILNTNPLQPDSPRSSLGQETQILILNTNLSDYDLTRSSWPSKKLKSSFPRPAPSNNNQNLSN